MEFVKSVRAVFAGVFVVVLLSELTDYGLSLLGIFPPMEKFSAFTTDMLVAAAIYRCVYAVIGGYVAAWYAPGRPMLHVLILGLIGLAASTAGAVLMWDLGRHWYPVTLAATSLPCVLLGGALYRRPA